MRRHGWSDPFDYSMQVALTCSHAHLSRACADMECVASTPGRGEEVTFARIVLGKSGVYCHTAAMGASSVLPNHSRKQEEQPLFLQTAKKRASLTDEERRDLQKQHAFFAAQEEIVRKMQTVFQASERWTADEWFIGARADAECCRCAPDSCARRGAEGSRDSRGLQGQQGAARAARSSRDRDRVRRRDWGMRARSAHRDSLSTAHYLAQRVKTPLAAALRLRTSDAGANAGYTTSARGQPAAGISVAGAT